MMAQSSPDWALRGGAHTLEYGGDTVGFCVFSGHGMGDSEWKDNEPLPRRSGQGVWPLERGHQGYG